MVYDFLINNKCDIIVWVNPIAPLQKSKEIKEVVNYFINKKLNSLITTNQLKNHAIYQKKPLILKIKINLQKLKI